MSGWQKTAVRHRVEEGFTPVPGSVHACSKPERPGPAKRKTEEEPDEGRAQSSDPGFALIAQMDRAKSGGEQYRCRPESDPLGQGELCVSPEKKFFKQAHDQEQNSPKRRKLQNADSVQG